MARGEWAEQAGRVREVGLSDDPVEVAFECFEFLPESLDVVERNLDSAVDVGCSSHVLRFPCLDRHG